MRPVSTASKSAADHVGRLHRALRARWRRSAFNRGYIPTIASAISRSGKCCKADKAALRKAVERDLSKISSITEALSAALTCPRTSIHAARSDSAAFPSATSLSASCAAWGLPSRNPRWIRFELGFAPCQALATADSSSAGTFSRRRPASAKSIPRRRRSASPSLGASDKSLAQATSPSSVPSAAKRRAIRSAMCCRTNARCQIDGGENSPMTSSRSETALLSIAHQISSGICGSPTSSSRWSSSRRLSVLPASRAPSLYSFEMSRISRTGFILARLGFI